MIRKNVLYSFLIKGWSGLVLLWLVPATLNCLGEYTNGVWLTVSSLLIWIDSLDIGLGNGLRNQLAIAIAHNDMKKSRELVSSTFFMLIFIIVPTMLLMLGVISNLNLYSLLNITPALVPNLYNVVYVCLTLVCATFIFKFIGNFYMGLQLPATNNLFVASGQTLTLLLTYIAYYTNCHSLLIIAIINTASPLLVYIVAYLYTFGVRYKRLSPSWKVMDLKTARSLFTVGVKFFTLQIAGVVLFFTSNIIISRLLSPSEVTPYQIVYRYFSLVILTFSIISTPYWSATTDAYEKGDLEWIKQSHKKMNKILVILYGITLIMVAASPVVFRLWIGTNTHIPFALTLMVAIYVSVLIGSLSYSYFLNGIGALHLQMVFTLFAAIVFIPLTIYTFKFFPTIYSIIAVMTLVNTPSLVCNKVQFHKIMTGSASKIWLK